jgi:hypothetical protein
MVTVSMSVLYVIFISLILSFNVLAQDFELRADNGDENVQSLIGLIEAKIPHEMKRAFAGPVTIVFTKLDNREQLLFTCEENTESGAHIHGEVRVNLLRTSRALSHIYINEGYLELFAEGRENERRCGRSIKTHLAEVILHELAHLYDFSDHRTADEKQFLHNHCTRLSGGRISYGKMPSRDERCRYLNRRGYYSGSYEFLSIDNWTTVRSSRNQETLNILDPYILEHAQESFAVHLALFLLDPSFSCRKPALHNYFKRILNHTPFGKQECSSLNTKLYGANELVDIDPSRIYQIHYFLAGKGERMMSRWGHAMLRIVMCSPERKELSEKCLTEDIGHDVIISFRAQVDDLSINMIKGLTGQYPSRMYVSRIHSVINEYNNIELREIHSLPLNFSRDQIKRFAYNVLETYWDYKGRYYFLGNNCTHEALFMINSALGGSQDHRLPELFLSTRNILSPIGIFERLKDMGLLMQADLSDNEKTRKGLYFPSRMRRINRALESLKSNSEHYHRIGSIYDYQLLPSSERGRLYDESIAQYPDKIKLISIAVFTLEQQVLAMKTVELEKKMQTYIRNNMDVLEDRLTEVRVNLLNREDFLRASRRSRYGVATIGEMNRLLEDYQEGEGQTLLRDLAVNIKEQEFPAENEEIKLLGQQLKIYLKNSL